MKGHSPQTKTPIFWKVLQMGLPDPLKTGIIILYSRLTRISNDNYSTNTRNRRS